MICIMLFAWIMGYGENEGGKISKGVLVVSNRVDRVIKMGSLGLYWCL